MDENVTPGSVCCFCRTSFDDEALYGKFYKIGDIITHYFCLLLSSQVKQRGSDNEGILGFLPEDISEEVSRGKKVVCTYCQKRGATIKCFASKCKVNFHLPCGRSRNTFHQFFGVFKSNCCKHRKTQFVKKEVLKAMSGKDSTCAICLESVPASPNPSTVWAPCCSKDAWFHRICIQRLALSAGYFFKCPLCNNTRTFVVAMRNCGIWIPEQDASWERDPDRYDGLLQRHNSCDAKICRCKQGRIFDMDNTKWELKLCADCGSQGMHVHCGNLRPDEVWVCTVCAAITTSKKHAGKTSLNAKRSSLACNRPRRSQSSRSLRWVDCLRSSYSTFNDKDNEEKGRNAKSVNCVTQVDDETSANIQRTGTTHMDVPSNTRRGSTSSENPSTVLSGALTPQKLVQESEKEHSTIEVVDLEDSSDDEIQCRRSKKTEPFDCTCNPSCPCRTRRPLGSSSSTRCFEWRKRRHYNGKSSPASREDYENDLVSRFFATIASYKEDTYEDLWIFHRYRNCHESPKPLRRVYRERKSRKRQQSKSINRRKKKQNRARSRSLFTDERSCEEIHNFNIGNGHALASLRSFQPVVVLEPYRLKGSVSVDKLSNGIEAGRSRKEQFENRRGRMSLNKSNKIVRSPIRTRSRSRELDFLNKTLEKDGSNCSSPLSSSSCSPSPLSFSSTSSLYSYNAAESDDTIWSAGMCERGIEETISMASVLKMDVSGLYNVSESCRSIGDPSTRKQEFSDEDYREEEFLSCKCSSPILHSSNVSPQPVSPLSLLSRVCASPLPLITSLSSSVSPQVSTSFTQTILESSISTSKDSTSSSAIPQPSKTFNDCVMQQDGSSTISPFSIRKLSPPPKFPKRCGSPTEEECRIKARALTARKFVPMSVVATQQREVIRQLQEH